MRSASLSYAFLSAGFVSALAFTSPAVAQAPAQQASAAPTLSASDITALAKVEVAIGVLRDSADVQMSMVGNKKVEVLQRIRDDLAAKIKATMDAAGTNQADYERRTYIVSTNANARKAFDSTIAKLTGVPTPGQVVASAAPAAGTVKVPAGPVGVHIGHVMNSFSDTPGKQGLLPVALAEAKTAAQHAALAARAPTNLDGMKLHAGHVINAIDPTIEPKGPGLGYGVKKAAMGIAMHIDLAAKAPGASQNVITHAKHVETSANNTVERCDQIVALAKQIQASTSAPAAAALVSQLVSLTSQLTAGFDANSDGKITWEKGEGGLQQVQEHMTLMLAGEGAQ